MEWWGWLLSAAAVILMIAAALFVWACLWVSARADQEM
jgi:hypothetical protein